MIYGFDNSDTAKKALRDSHGNIAGEQALRDAYKLNKKVDVNAVRLTTTALNRSTALRKWAKGVTDADPRLALARNTGGIRTAMHNSYYGSPYDTSPAQWGRRANAYGSGGPGLGAYEIATLEGFGVVPLFGEDSKQERTYQEKRAIVFDMDAKGVLSAKYLPYTEGDKDSLWGKLFSSKERPVKQFKLPAGDLTFVSFTNIDRQMQGATGKPPYQFVVARSAKLGEEVFVNPGLAVKAGLITAEERPVADKLKTKAEAEKLTRKHRMLKQDVKTDQAHADARKDAEQIRCREGIVALGVPFPLAKIWCGMSATKTLLYGALAVGGLVLAPSVIRIIKALRS